ncbi:MAG: EAL domain-containing protein [Byssovorax sp.]
MTATSPEIADADDALIQFMYQAPIGLAQTKLDGEIEMINPMAASLLMPLSRDGSLDNLFLTLEGVAPGLRELTAAFAAPAGMVCEAVRIQIDPGLHGNAELKVFCLSLLKLDDARLIVMLSDVTLAERRDQQALTQKLSQAARIDSLTRMPNRAVALEHVHQAMERARAGGDCHFAVLFMNCDRFKQINDTHGHAAGNEVLGLLADRLRGALRRRDAISHTAGEQLAARVGGDEFVVVLDDLARPDDVHPVAQRLLDVLSKPYGVERQQLHCGVSIGIVMQAQASGDADSVLQHASIATAEAKRVGGARYVIFEPAMAQRAARRGAVESDLRTALSGGELFVVYQPVVGLKGACGIDRSAGLEALVRWRHPTRGVVPPLEFIGVAEECGLIGPIGDFVLGTAVRQLAQWQKELGSRAPRTMAVNLSRAQLAQPGFAARVGDVLRSCGIAPERLQLEVTESLAAQDETVQSRLHELKALGVTLALDDFGTGYSSLASLHQLPIDTVKIDRSFISQADTSDHHRVLIEATIRVARSLGMSTVAEGIETEAQAAVIRELGGDKGQGYLFSRPLPVADATRWFLAAEAAQSPARAAASAG